MGEPRSAARARRMDNETRARVAGLTSAARQGSDHMAELGRRGRAALDRRIARDAGIPDGLAPADYAARLALARKAHYIRLNVYRWPDKGQPTKGGTR
jgi:hypothetical protein